MYKIKIGGVQIGECEQQISYPHASVLISKNVSETCKEFGISRTIYYKWSKAYQQHGMDGLGEKKRKPVMPNKVDKRTERLILEYVARFPEDVL